jgi:hypothetical protein
MLKVLQKSIGSKPIGIFTRRNFCLSKQNNVNRLDKFMNIHFMLAIPAGGIGFCYGVNESWKEHIFQDDLVKSSLAATAYGVFGFMFGSVAWIFTPVILPVVGASYIKTKLKN